MFAAPCNCSRWRFLGQVGAGFGALALSALWRLEAQAAGAKVAVDLDLLNPFKPREPHFAPRAKSVIFLFMVGWWRREAWPAPRRDG